MKISEKMGCEVKNYGVGGYSYVQAFLKYKLYKPEEDLIIFTIYEEMLKRSLASSSNTLKESSLNTIGIRPYLNREYKIVEIKEPFEESTKFIQNHMNYEWYQMPKISFLFFPNLVRFAFNEKFRISDGVYRYYNAYENIWESYKRHDYLAIFYNWIRIYEKDFVNKKVLLVFLPGSTFLERWESI